jgi:hypothetical protein
MFNLDVYDKTLSDLIHKANASNQYELEFRFSDATRRDHFSFKSPAKASCRPNNWVFKPSISLANFDRILSSFENSSLKREQCQSVDTFYKMSSPNPKNLSSRHERPTHRDKLRHTLSRDATGNMTSLWVSKQNCTVIDAWNVNMRIALSSESRLSRTAPPNETPTNVRRKKRTSFFDGCARYDFTIIDSENYEQRPFRKFRTFEIEIEYIHIPSWNLDDSIIHIKHCIMYMLTLINDSPVVATLSEKHNVLLEYTMLSNQMDPNGVDVVKLRFIGAQPESLHRRHLPLIHKIGMYSITEKFDGERFLLFISDNRNAYLISRVFKVKATGLFNEIDKGTILDVEYINGLIFVFDVVMYHGNDLRGNISYRLKERLNLAHDVIVNFRRQNDPNERSFMPIYLKDYHFGEFDHVISNFADEDTPDDGLSRDGFIYTPVKECYPLRPKWNTLLKWKPAHLNSIDFVIKRKENLNATKDAKANNVYNLFVGGKDAVLVPFTEHPTITIDNDTMHHLMGSNADSDNLGVIECVWHSQKETFIPIRKRLDKYSPNYITVAIDVWESIMNPVHLSDLYGSTFSNMRKLHNHLKSYIIREAVASAPKSETIEWKDWADLDGEDDDDLGQTTIHVLDLACGRGGDLWKWSRVTRSYKRFEFDTVNLHYVGVDIDHDLLNEAKRRVNRVVQTSDSRFETYEFHSHDLTEQSYIYSPRNYFNIVSCQFAMHYFYASKEVFQRFITTLKTNLIDNGVFIATLFDGERVFSLCNQKRNKQIHVMNNHGFDIVPKFDTDASMQELKRNVYGIPITAVLLGEDDVILREPTKEFLVFADDFAVEMKRNGFTLLDTNLFMHYDDAHAIRETLSSIECAYSDLHRYYIFQYTKSTLEKQSSADWMNITVNETEIDKLLERQCSTDTETKGVCASCNDHILRMIESITGLRRELVLSPDDMKLFSTGNFDDQTLLERIAQQFGLGISILSTDTVTNVQPDVTKDLQYIWVKRLDNVREVHFHILADEQQTIIFKRPMTLKTPKSEGKVEENKQSSDGNSNTKKMDDDGNSGRQKHYQFMGKLVHGGKNAWTIKQLHEYANSVDVKIPVSIRRKNDIVQFLLRHVSPIGH